MTEITVKKLQSLLTVSEVAAMFDVPARVVRKAAKASPPTIPGMIKALGKYGFDPDLVAAWEVPAAGERVVGARREDGRQRYRIYLTPEEAAKLLTEGYEVTDPRKAAAERRAAKKTTAGEVESPLEEDPFADFGA